VGHGYPRWPDNKVGVLVAPTYAARVRRLKPPAQTPRRLRDAERADRKRLKAPDALFAETNWRKIRAELLTQWNLLFEDNRINKIEWLF